MQTGPASALSPVVRRPPPILCDSFARYRSGRPCRSCPVKLFPARRKSRGAVIIVWGGARGKRRQRYRNPTPETAVALVDGGKVDQTQKREKRKSAASCRHIRVLQERGREGPSLLPLCAATGTRYLSGRRRTEGELISVGNWRRWRPPRPRGWGSGGG